MSHHYPCQEPGEERCVSVTGKQDIPQTNFQQIGHLIEGSLGKWVIWQKDHLVNSLSTTRPLRVLCSEHFHGLNVHRISIINIHLCLDRKLPWDREQPEQHLNVRQFKDGRLRENLLSITLKLGSVSSQEVSWFCV